MAQVIDVCDEETNVDEGRREMEVSPTFCLQSLAMQNTIVHLAGITGNIDGLVYEGARTNGNGACALHAPFGK